MDNPETLATMLHKIPYEDKQNKTQKSKKMNNTDPTTNRDESSSVF